MRIASLFILASMTTLFACGGDDSDDTAGETGTATDTATATATDSASASATDTDSASATDTDSASATDTDPSTSGDPTTGVDSTGTDTGGADVCAQYCTAYLANCTGDNGTQYADEQACLDACAGWDVGEPGAMDGDSAECRLYHAGAAAGAPEVHCVHAQEEPEAACV